MGRSVGRTGFHGLLRMRVAPERAVFLLLQKKTAACMVRWSRTERRHLFFLRSSDRVSAVRCAGGLRRALRRSPSRLSTIRGPRSLSSGRADETKQPGFTPGVKRRFVVHVPCPYGVSGTDVPPHPYAPPLQSEDRVSAVRCAGGLRRALRRSPSRLSTIRGPRSLSSGRADETKQPGFTPGVKRRFVVHVPCPYGVSGTDVPPHPVPPLKMSRADRA